MNNQRHRHNVALQRRRLLSIWCLVVLFVAGCDLQTTTSSPPAASATPPTATSKPVSTATATPPPTATTNPEDCAALIIDPGPAPDFVPPHTISSVGNGAARAGFFIECTPNVTATYISTYVENALIKEGYRRWNPQTDNANGCGTEPNANWMWVKGQEAIEYDFTGFTLPKWSLVLCGVITP